MNRLIIITIFFFSIINCSYCQESTSDIDRLTNIIKNDSLADRLMNKFTSKIISNAEKQIQGAGAKEKLDTYTKFIKKESNELSKAFTNIVIPDLYNKHFTPDEIKNLIMFYETPTGKKLLFETTELMNSLEFTNLEIPQTYSKQFTPEELKDFKAFYKTPTGKKLFKEMTELMTELMTSLYKDYIPDFQQKIKKELQRLDSKIWREAYRVKPEQVIVYQGEFSGVKKIIRIKNDTITQETYVTFAVPIYENKFWIRFDKNTEIIDKDSNEHYLSSRLDNDLILNKTMIVSDQKGKMIEVTLVFPLLKKSVKVIDIGEKISDDADLMSNNSGGKNSLINLKVKDYL